MMLFGALLLSLYASSAVFADSLQGGHTLGDRALSEGTPFVIYSIRNDMVIDKGSGCNTNLAMQYQLLPTDDQLINQLFTWNGNRIVRANPECEEGSENNRALTLMLCSNVAPLKLPPVLENSNQQFEFVDGRLLSVDCPGEAVEIFAHVKAPGARLVGYHITY